MDSAWLLVGFLNSDAGGDRLATPDGAARWAAEAGLLPPGTWVDPTAALRLRRVREALREGLAGEGFAALDQEAAQVPVSVLVGEGGEAALVAARPGPDEVVAAVLGAMVLAQADGSWHRVKVCRRPGCRTAFLDGSRNRSRQWCDMARCGTPVKMRAYRARLRIATGRDAAPHVSG